MPKPTPQDHENTGDAPPPYTSPSGSQPHQTYLPPPAPSGAYVESALQPDIYGWTPPPNERVAAARAQRRFWIAMVYGFGIWILIGLLLGGGISDIDGTPSGRHGHWDKHGEWRDDRH